MEEKTVLFAATPQDAVDYCKVHNLDFTKIVWVMNYQLLGEKGLVDVTQVLYTDLFKMMPAYSEAVAMWKRDKGDDAVE